MASGVLHRLRLHRLWALAAMAALAGCGAFEGPQSATGEHTICYSKMASSVEEVRTAAKDACGGAQPRYGKQEIDMSACPILVPERLYVTCPSQSADTPSTSTPSAGGQ